MGLWLMYVSINEVLVTGYQLNATAAKNWKLQKFCKFFTSHIHMLLIQLLIWWYIPFENKLKTITFLGKQCSIWRNKKKSVTKVSLLVCMYSISKTVGIFTDTKDSITCRFHSLNKEISMFCFWFHESYLLDEYCLYTTFMLKCSMFKVFKLKLAVTNIICCEAAWLAFVYRENPH